MKNTVLVLGLAALLAVPAIAGAEIIYDANGVKIEDLTPAEAGNVSAAQIGLVPLRIQLDKEYEAYALDGQGGQAGLAALVKVTLQAGASFILTDEIITNNTGVDWLDFHVLVIPDTGVLDVTGEVVNGNAFTNMVKSPNQLDFDGGVFPSGVSKTLFLSDAGDPIIFSNPATSGVTTFYIKEWPTVPEPATMGMLAIGGLAGVVLRRRRRK